MALAAFPHPLGTDQVVAGRVATEPVQELRVAAQAQNLRLRYPSLQISPLLPARVVLVKFHQVTAMSALTAYSQQLPLAVEALGVLVFQLQALAELAVRVVVVVVIRLLRPQVGQEQPRKVALAAPDHFTPATHRAAVVAEHRSPVLLLERT